MKAALLVAVCALVVFGVACGKPDLNVLNAAAIIETDPKFVTFNPPAILPGYWDSPCFQSDFVGRSGERYAVIGEGKTLLSGVLLNGDRLLVQFRTPYKKNVKNVVSLQKQADGSTNAVFEYGWDATSFPARLKECIEGTQPQQALAFMIYDSGKWKIKDMVVEKFELHPVSN